MKGDESLGGRKNQSKLYNVANVRTRRLIIVHTLQLAVRKALAVAVVLGQSRKGQTAHTKGLVRTWARRPQGLKVFLANINFS